MHHDTLDSPGSVTQTNDKLHLPSETLHVVYNTSHNARSAVNLDYDLDASSSPRHGGQSPHAIRIARERRSRWQTCETGRAKCGCTTWRDLENNDQSIRIRNTEIRRQPRAESIVGLCRCVRLSAALLDPGDSTHAAHEAPPPAGDGWRQLRAPRKGVGATMACAESPGLQSAAASHASTLGAVIVAVRSALVATRRVVHAVRCDLDCGLTV